MNRIRKEISPFLGVHTSIDPRKIGDNYSPDMQNVSIEDGALRPRYGYRAITSVAGQGVESVHGLEYLEGYYNKPNDPHHHKLANEYLTFEQFTSATLRPISDQSVSGWTASPGGSLFPCIDESVQNDTDYVEAATGESNKYKFKVTAPSSTILPGTCVRLSVRCGLTGSLTKTNLSVRLLKDSTEIGAGTVVLTNQVLLRSIDFQPEAEIAAGANLYIELTPMGEANTVRLTQAYVSVLAVRAVAVYGAPGSGLLATRTEIKRGNTAVRLSATTWRGFAWQQYAYLYNSQDSSPLYRHELGNWNSFTPIQTPADPTAAPTFSVTSGGQNTPYPRFLFKKTTGVTYDGNPSGVFYDAGKPHQLRFTCKVLNVDSFIQINLKEQMDGAAVNWANNDCFMFYFYSNWTVIDPGSMSVLLSNEDGTTFVPTNVQLGGKQNNNVHGTAMWLRIEFTDKDRDQWANMHYLRFDYSVVGGYDGGGSPNDLFLIPFVIGGIRLEPKGTQAESISIAYSYYNSTAEFESGLSPALTVPVSALKGSTPGGIAGLDPLGVNLRIAHSPSSDTTVNKWRLYVKDDKDKWRRVTTADKVPTYAPYNQSWTSIDKLPEWKPTPFTFKDIVCATPFKGWVVWGYKGGVRNIRHSRVGSPEALHSDLDALDDDTRGADFSLADDYGDEPLSMFQAGDAVIIVGSQGVYAQVGNTPSAMTPPKKLAGSVGCANAFACCRWKDDAGNPGVAFLSRFGDAVYFATVFDNFDGENGFRMIEVTEPVRGLLHKYLLEGQGLTDFSTCRLGVHEAKDALWIVMGRRAIVLRRRTALDGARQFEPYAFAMPSATVAYLSFTARGEMRWIRTSGEMDSVERDPGSSNYIFDDDGAPIPSIYWRSKVFTGPNRRIDLVQVWRDNPDNVPSVTIDSTRLKSTDPGAYRVYSAGALGKRFSPLQQGEEHQITLTMNHGDEPYRRLVVEEIGPISRRARR